MMMNEGVDDEIEDSWNHFHSKMGLELFTPIFGNVNFIIHQWW